MNDAVDLVLTGMLRTGTDRNLAIARLAELMRLDLTAARDMVCEKPMTLRHRVAPQEAQRLAMLIEDFGLGIRLEQPVGRATSIDNLAISVEGSPRLAKDNVSAMGSLSLADTASADEKPIPTDWAVLNTRDDKPAQYSRGHRGEDRQVDSEWARVNNELEAAPTGSSNRANDLHRPPPVPFADRPAAGFYVSTASAVQQPAPGLLGLNFDGRIGRIHYLCYATLLLLGLFPLAIVLGLAETLLHGVTYLLPIIALWAFTRIAILRAHDFGLSATWVLVVSFAPVVLQFADKRLGIIASIFSLLLSLALCVMPGYDGDNRFGARAAPASPLLKISGILGTALILVVGVFAVRQFEKFADLLGNNGLNGAVSSQFGGTDSQGSASDDATDAPLLDKNGNPISDAQIHQMAEQLRSLGMHTTDEEFKAQLRKKARRKSLADEHASGQ